MVDESTRFAGAFYLNELAVIEIAGDDAQAFLQAQLTSDIKALKINSAQYTAYCSPKGRMLANGYLACIGEAHYQWIVHSSVMDRLLKRLSMFVLRSKVKLQRSEARCAGQLSLSREAIEQDVLAPAPVGLPAEHSQPQPLQVISVTADCTTLLLPGGRTLLVTPEAASLPENEQKRYEWNLASIAADEVLVVEATCEELIPQMIDWDRLGGVSFKKGCYPGQEIVARSHYLGKMKRRLFLASFSGGAANCAPAIGETVVDAANPEQSIGVVVRTAVSDPSGTQKGAVLAVISTDLLKADSVLQVANTSRQPLENIRARFIIAVETPAAKLNL